MSNHKKIDLIDIYPLIKKVSVDSDGNKNCHPAFHHHCIEERCNSKEYAKKVMNGDNGSLDKEIFDKITKHQTYKDNKSKRQDNEVLRDYIQNHSPSKDNSKINSDLDELILSKGILLAEGQILFHGGVWGCGFDNIKTGQEFISTKPLSTSFTPSVAHAHAKCHIDFCNHQNDSGCYDQSCPKCGHPPMIYEGSVWHITIGKDISTPALITNFSNGKHSNEMEVVFASSANIRCDNVVKEADWLFPLVFVTIT